MDLSSYAGKFQKQQPLFSAPRSAWEEQLDAFLSRLNPARETAGYKPYTHARLAGILAKQGIRDAESAYRFYRQCDSGRSFSRLFSHLTKKA